MSVDDIQDKAAQFRAWVQRISHVWSHVHVAALAIRIGDAWIALRFSAVLADTDRGPDPWGMPVADEDQIFAFRTALPVEGLAALIDAAVSGRIDGRTAPGLDRALDVSAPGTSEKTSAHFQKHFDTPVVGDPVQGTVSRAEFRVTVQGEP